MLIYKTKFHHLTIESKDKMKRYFPKLNCENDTHQLCSRPVSVVVLLQLQLVGEFLFVVEILHWFLLAGG